MKVRCMKFLDDRNYHLIRAEEERLRAEEATDPAVAKIHHQLSVLHRRKLMTMVDDAGFLLPPLGVRARGSGR